VEGCAEKEGFKPGMKESAGNEKIIIMSMTVSSVRSINDRVKFYIVECSAQLPSTLLTR